MDCCFITDGTINEIWQEKLASVVDCELVVFGFNGLGLVSYKSELDGKTEYFQDLARFSRQISSVVICGCDTETYGVFRHSAVIADKGKILGVSDAVHSIDESEFISGGNFRVYDTSIGKIGILIAEDLFFHESSRVLASCDADIIICILKEIENSIPQIMLRSCAFSNGVAMALVSKNYFTVANIRGNVSFAGNRDINKVKVKIEKDYHLVGARRRGFYREFPRN